MEMDGYFLFKFKKLKKNSHTLKGLGMSLKKMRFDSKTISIL